MATQAKIKKSVETDDERIIYLSRDETVGLIKNLLDLLTTGFGGVENIRVNSEDGKESYRLYIIPKKPETEEKFGYSKVLAEAAKRPKPVKKSGKIGYSKMTESLQRLTASPLIKLPPLSTKPIKKAKKRK